MTLGTMLVWPGLDTSARLERCMRRTSEATERMRTKEVVREMMRDRSLSVAPKR